MFKGWIYNRMTSYYWLEILRQWELTQWQLQMILAAKSWCKVSNWRLMTQRLPLSMKTKMLCLLQHLMRVKLVHIKYRWKHALNTIQMNAHSVNLLIFQSNQILKTSLESRDHRWSIAGLQRQSWISCPKPTWLFKRSEHSLLEKNSRKSPPCSLSLQTESSRQFSNHKMLKSRTCSIIL